MDLNTFKLSALRTARAEGLAPPDVPSITWMLLGTTNAEFGTRKRRITVSTTEPPLFDGAETQLWLNSSDLTIWKSTNWISPTGPTFKEVSSYEDLFEDKQDIASQLPPDIATKSYVNTVLSDIQAGGGITNVLTPVQNLSALRAVSVVAVPDKSLIYVEDEHQLYGYDFGSAVAEDAFTVRPASGVGRWIVTGPAKLDGGTF